MTGVFDARRARRLLWLLFCLWGTASAAQPGPVPDAVPDGLRAALQAALTARHAAAAAEPLTFPGATLAVSLPDGRVLEFATGFADRSAAIPMTPGSRMPSGSIGKTFVAALTLS